MVDILTGKLARQFIGYSIAGGIAFLIDFGLLYLLTERYGQHYLFSATVGFLVGVAANYLICIAWVFDFRRMADPIDEFMVFGAIGIAGLAMNNLLLYGLTDHGGLHYLMSKGIAATAILAVNFSLRRHWLFSRSPTSHTIPTT